MACPSAGAPSRPLSRSWAGLTLYHVSPLTRGSIAVWDVRPVMESPAGPPTSDLVVHSQVRVPLPIIGPLLARHFVGGRVGRQFGQAMAARIKQRAEAAIRALPQRY